jgi:hypothetical protein
MIIFGSPLTAPPFVFPSKKSSGIYGYPRVFTRNGLFGQTIEQIYRSWIDFVISMEEEVRDETKG